MVFESLTLGVCITCLFAYYSRRYGLGKDVPVDASGKAHVWANEALGVLKTQLAHATIHELNASAVRFTNEEGQGRLACEAGRLTLALEGKAEQVLNHEGQAVQLHFEKLSEQGLLARLEVKVPPDGAHDVGLRVEVKFA